MMVSSRLGLTTWDMGRFARMVVRPNLPAPRGCPAVDNVHDLSPIGTAGYVVLKGVVDPARCSAVIADYDQYERRLLDYGVALRDQQGRNRRLTNFHLVSAAAMEIATDDRIHDVSDRYFGRRSMVYTSLYYKHGSQQAAHIDTPFFVTNPVGWFAGVWVALEDVRGSAGPVEYFPGTHRLFDNKDKLWDLYSGCKDLEQFFARVREKALSVTPGMTAELKAGDILIWHHGLPHAGKIATDPSLTRHSMVFHMGAEGVNIRTSGLFDRDPRIELPRYGRLQHGKRLVARVSLPEIML